MSAFLFGVPGKLQKILNRITNSTKPLNDTRVGNLDTIPLIESDTSTIKNRIPSDNATHINRLDVNTSSRLSTVFGTRRVQTGYIVNNSVSDGIVGEDDKFINITISSVANTAKCLVDVSQMYAWNGSGNRITNDVVTGRLTSTTNLRIGIRDNTAAAFLGRWYVVELQ